MDPVAEIVDGPRGPRIAAFFDLDGTLVDGFTAAVHMRHRIRSRQARFGELTGTIEAAWRYRFGRMRFEHLLRRAGRLSERRIAGRAARAGGCGCTPRTSRAGLGSDAFYNSLGRYYDLKSVITSGAGRCFRTGNVVKTFFILEKKVDPEQASGDVKFVVLTRPCRTGLITKLCRLRRRLSLARLKMKL